MTGTEIPPSDYGVVRDRLEREVRASRAAAFRAVNAEMLALYRTIGGLLDRQQRKGWTTHELDQLIADLRAAFPEMAGLTPANLDEMRRFAAAWPDPAIAPAVDQLPWGTHPGPARQGRPSGGARLVRRGLRRTWLVGERAAQPDHGGDTPRCARDHVRELPSAPK
jgi:hypothetical protein